MSLDLVLKFDGPPGTGFKKNLSWQWSLKTGVTIHLIPYLTLYLKTETNSRGVGERGRQQGVRLEWKGQGQRSKVKRIRHDRGEN